MAVYVKRADLEAFVELVGGRFYGPSTNRARAHVAFVLPESGVKAELSFSTILNKGAQGRFYGRQDYWGFDERSDVGWNEIKLNTSPLDNFSFFGKGARALATYAEAREFAALLAGREIDQWGEFVAK